MTQPNNKTTLLEETDSGTLIAQAGTAGNTWQVLSYKAPILPIHAALFHTGKILFFCGSGNDPSHLNTPYNSVLWDVNAGTFIYQGPPLNSNNQPIDLFCAGHSFTPNGMLMVAGGTLRYDPFYGLPTAVMFDPIAEKWINMPSMNNGRWYPNSVNTRQWSDISRVWAWYRWQPQPTTRNLFFDICKWLERFSKN
ncbi:hypothetical protein [Nostoc sp. C052]|uniref:hypothetical protein n=1 Tax=Nostoc sp. C052 TaxID=2576902 RepID=UPI002118F360|nr:hypothetical protein [Nostoc sp. C052]